MNLSYLKYLKCFRGPDQFSIYQFKAGKLELVSVINNEEIIRIGLLVCNDCHRFFPIDEGILYMLPDNLVGGDNNKFIKKYNIVSSVNYKKKEIHLVNKPEEEEESIFHKKNEMATRDEQADIYHTYGYRIFGINEKKYFMKFLKPSSKDVIVELGCGTGRITKEIITFL